jgi:hypothetical protein
MKKGQTIVKVQSPLQNYGVKMQPWEQLLVYDRERKHTEMRNDKALYARLEGSPKTFFYAEWDGQAWVIGERCKWQAW